MTVQDLTGLFDYGYRANDSDPRQSMGAQGSLPNSSLAGSEASGNAHS